MVEGFMTIAGLAGGALGAFVALRYLRIGIASRRSVPTLEATHDVDGNEIPVEEARAQLRQVSAQAFCYALWLALGSVLLVSVAVFGELSGVTGAALLLLGAGSLVLAPRAFRVRLPGLYVAVYLATCALGLLLMAPMILTTWPSLGGQGVVELADRLYPVLNRLLAVAAVIGFLNAIGFIVAPEGRIGIRFGTGPGLPGERRIPGWLLIVPAGICWGITGDPGSLINPFVELWRWLF